MHDYYCHLGLKIVSIFNKDDIDPEDELPYGDSKPLLSMTPEDALALARHILADERSLKIGNAALHKQFEKESQQILNRFPDVWKQHRSEIVKRDASNPPDCWQIKGMLLCTRDELFHHGEIFERGDEFTELFWKYFHRIYDEQLRKEYLTAQEEE